MTTQLLFKKLKEAMQNKDYTSVKKITKELVEMGFNPNPKIISEYDVITGQRIKIISINDPVEETIESDFFKEIDEIYKIRNYANENAGKEIYRNTIFKNGEDAGAYAD